MRSNPPRAPSAPTRSKTPSTPGGTAKGFYFRALQRELASHGQYQAEATPYREFNDYPITDAQALLAECALRLYPSLRRPEALRRLGWIIFPTFLSTMVGRVIFGALGNDFPAVLRAGSRGFEVSISQGRYELVELDKQRAHVRVRDFPLYPDSFLAGVFEGALAHYGFDEGSVLATSITPTDCDFYLSW
jgi:uncharacterized protein (TIGR02265 family)